MKKHLVKIIFLLILFIVFQSCTSKSEHPTAAGTSLLLGSDQLIRENLNLLKNKNIGIICNHASVLANGTLLVDTLLTLKDVTVKKIFTPEHDFYINRSAGQKFYNSTYRNVPVYSLYGDNVKPTPEILSNIDLLIYDLQDIGTRFYTYISTLFYIIQSASANNIPLIILDRPDPINGENIEGPVLKPEYKSFIGIAPIPVVYGLTAGELSKMMIGEKWINPINSSVEIIKMKNWKRENYFDDLNLNWIKPSPNIPDQETAILYPGVALLEGTNISEGRGTETPFKVIGSPFINPDQLIKELDSLDCKGINFEKTFFVPETIIGQAENPKYENEKCFGIKLNVTDRESFNSFKFGIKLLYSINILYSEKLKFRINFFDKMTGNSSIRNMLKEGLSPDSIAASWQKSLNEFKREKKKIYFILKERKMKKLFVIILTGLIIYGCGDQTKQENKPADKDQFTFDTTDLKTAPVENPNQEFYLRYKLKKGETYHFRLTAISKDDQSISSKDTTLSQGLDQTMVYNVSFIPTEIDADSSIEMSVNISSIKVDGKFGNEEVHYQSGVTKDTAEINKYAQYESLVNNSFDVRVSKIGELLDIFKTDKIVTKLLDIRKLSDSLKTDEKANLKNDITEGVLKPLISQVFRKLPINKTAVDSSWKVEQAVTQLMVFQAQNTSIFTIKNVKNLDGDLIAEIEAGLKTKITGKNKLSDRGVNYEFKQPVTSGGGKIYFNVSKGLVQKTKLSTAVSLSFNMESQGQKGTKTESISNTNNLEYIP